MDVGGAAPIGQRPCRVGAARGFVMSQEVSCLVESGLASSSSGPWSSPCLLVPRPAGAFRFCADCGRVNAVAVPDSCPLPRVGDCVGTVGSARCVTRLVCWAPWSRLRGLRIANTLLFLLRLCCVVPLFWWLLTLRGHSRWRWTHVVWVPDTVLCCPAGGSGFAVCAPVF